MAPINAHYWDLLRALAGGSDTPRARHAALSFAASVRAANRELLIAIDAQGTRPARIVTVTRLLEQHGVTVVCRRSPYRTTLRTYARPASAGRSAADWRSTVHRHSEGMGSASSTLARRVTAGGGVCLCLCGAWNVGVALGRLDR